MLPLLVSYVVCKKLWGRPIDTSGVREEPIVTSWVKRRLLRSTVSLQCRCFPFFAIEHLEERKRWSSTEANLGIKNSKSNSSSLWCTSTTPSLWRAISLWKYVCVQHSKTYACFLFYTTRTWSMYCFFCSSSTLGGNLAQSLCCNRIQGIKKPIKCGERECIAFEGWCQNYLHGLHNAFFQLDICFSSFTCGTLASITEPILLKWLKFGFMYVYQFPLTLICYACS